MVFGSSTPAMLDLRQSRRMRRLGSGCVARASAIQTSSRRCSLTRATCASSATAGQRTAPRRGAPSRAPWGIGHCAATAFSLSRKNRAERFIGWAGLLHPEGWPGVEIAWGFAPSCWGQGFATEAAASVLRYAFDRLRLPRLASIIHPENAASIRVAMKIGERFERSIEFQGKSLHLYAIAAAL
jgi:hypothetical protein